MGPARGSRGRGGGAAARCTQSRPPQRLLGLAAEAALTNPGGGGKVGPARGSRGRGGGEGRRGMCSVETTAVPARAGYCDRMCQ